MVSEAERSPVARLRAQTDVVSSSVCSVCQQKEPHIRMPCCGREGSAGGCCRRCIEIICEQARGVGRCPSCRQYITVDGIGLVQVTHAQSNCRVCRQVKTIVLGGMCDECALGARFRLHYECQKCSRVQVIPHPMWRYQPRPTSFGAKTWVCHQGCRDYTCWRVTEQDAALVPDFDCPESWGRREEWLARVRRQRDLEREGGASPRPQASGGECAVQ